MLSATVLPSNCKEFQEMFPMLSSIPGKFFSKAYPVD